VSATEKLRKLLDERGVEWHQDVDQGGYYTEWNSQYGECNALEWYPRLTLVILNLTPEQAVEATLGRETCRADETATWDCVCDGVGHYGEHLTVHVMECSACGHTYEHVNGSYEYCPRCGRKVE